MNLKGKDFLKLLDFTPAEIEYLIDLAAELKDKKKKGENLALNQYFHSYLLDGQSANELFGCPVPLILQCLCLRNHRHLKYSR